MKEVNMTIGRFQPFTNGHLQMCKDGYDKNGLPTVVLMITNKRPDQRHPFSDDLVKREIDIVKKNSPFIEDVLMVSNADIVKAGQILKENGYVAQMWLCGEDREEPYRKQAENPKYREQGGYPEGFTTYTGTGRTEGVSGTAVREAVKDGDRSRFKQLMPKGTDRLFGEFQKEMSKIEESVSRRSLSEYLTDTFKTDILEFKASRKSSGRTPDIKEIRPGDRLRLKQLKELSGYRKNRLGEPIVGLHTIYKDMWRFLGSTLTVEATGTDKQLRDDSTDDWVMFEGCPYYWPLEITEIP